MCAHPGFDPFEGNDLKKASLFLVLVNFVNIVICYYDKYLR